ncbi:hypothetical protein M8J75_003060 [Diaphorina citri]|nr:hypothetical protein M8J75_003060 [Diaphorina citri]
MYLISQTVVCSKLINSHLEASQLRDVNWYEPDRTMESPSIGGRKRATTKSAAEDQALDQIAKDAGINCRYKLPT